MFWRWDGCPLPFRLRRGQAVAVDVSLAALLGEGVYNFGELLLHPIVPPPPPPPPPWRSATAHLRISAYVCVCLLQRCSALLHGLLRRYGMQTHMLEFCIAKASS